MAVSSGDDDKICSTGMSSENTFHAVLQPVSAWNIGSARAIAEAATACTRILGYSEYFYVERNGSQYNEDDCFVVWYHDALIFLGGCITCVNHQASVSLFVVASRERIQIRSV